MLWTGGLEILREMLHLRLGRPHTGVGKRHKKFQNSRLFTVTKVGFHSNKAFPLSHDQPFISTPLTRSIGQMFVISFICGGAGLYFYICVFHRLLHFLCTEDLSISRPHITTEPAICQSNVSARGGRGHLYGTPSARPPRDKSNPWQTKPPIARWTPFD